MQTFRILKPISILAPYVRYYWILQEDAVVPVSERVLPAGCVQLIFHKGERLWLQGEREFQPPSFVCGQTFNYSDVQSTGKIEMITVVLQPYAAKAFFRMPIRLFQGRNVNVEDIEDDELSILSKRISDTPDNDLCIRFIEEFLVHRLRLLSDYNLKRVAAAIHHINIYPQAGISDLAEVTCLSGKQFSRIFTDYVGLTSKEFMRVVRLHKALYALQTDPAISFVRLAYDCGFSDQSHMIREFKQFSGYTPAEYLSICSPYSDYFSSL